MIVGALIRRCGQCGEEKPQSAFSPTVKRGDKVYLRTTCKPCAAKHARQWARDNVQRASATKRRSDLKWMYGMTVADYDTLLSSQGGVCAICRQSETMTRKGKPLRMPVDHDHITGEVRGILCHRCNRALGMLGDNAFILRRAISYVTRFGAAMIRKVG